MLSNGDVVSARLLYERAAVAGDGGAALRLGETFDPTFLALTRIHARGDAPIAAHWYERARELGETRADILLKALSTRQNRAP
jgi:TPR repeat protein